MPIPLRRGRRRPDDTAAEERTRSPCTTIGSDDDARALDPSARGRSGGARGGGDPERVPRSERVRPRPGPRRSATWSSPSGTAPPSESSDGRSTPTRSAPIDVMVSVLSVAVAHRADRVAARRRSGVSAQRSAHGFDISTPPLQPGVEPGLRLGGRTSDGESRTEGLVAATSSRAATTWSAATTRSSRSARPRSGRSDGRTTPKRPVWSTRP